MKKQSIKYYLHHPGAAWRKLRASLSDKYAIELQWNSRMPYPLNLRSPKGFMEKLNWLKLYDHNPQYTMMADKVLVKGWVANKIGEKYIIPTIAVYNTVDDINANELPSKFVLKCNHDSGSTIVCADKTQFDIEDAKQRLSRNLSRNYYYDEYEWVYKHIQPKIIVEEYVDNTEDTFAEDSLVAYKFMCFNGEPKIMYVTVKNDDIWEDYFDMNYNPLDIRRRYRHSGISIPKPETWGEMKQVAKILSSNIPFVRVDLYEIAGQIKFSECTFYDWGGYCAFSADWEQRLGNWLQLPY